MIRKATIFTLLITFLGAGALFGQSCLYLSTEALNPPSSSTALTNQLENEWGYDVTYKNIGNYTTPIIQPANYDFMIIDEIISSSDSEPVAQDYPIPVLNLEGWASDFFGITASGEEMSSKNLPTQPITIVDEDHPVAGGLSGDIDVTGTQGEEMLIHYLATASAVTVVGEASESGNPVLTAVEAGAQLDNEQTAQNRLVTFGIHNNAYEGLTDDAFTLIKASIDWLIGEGTDIEDENANPVTFQLQQNYPNPFNPETQISFTLQKESPTSLKVYNAKGQLVETLLEGSMQAGSHNVTFNGAGLPSGVYLYKLTSGEFSEVNKMLLVK